MVDAPGRCVWEGRGGEGSVTPGTDGCKVNGWNGVTVCVVDGDARVKWRKSVADVEVGAEWSVCVSVRGGVDGS